jgi:simple sugar transport system permease protein
MNLKALRQRALAEGLVTTISLATALAVAAVFLALAGYNPADAYSALFTGAFTNEGALSETLVAMIPYVLLGLAVALGFRAGLFNIGAEGQFYLGALFGVFTGYSFHGLPGFVHLPLALLAGVLGGFIWGVIPGILKARGAHEVITTIMLNYVAFSLADYLINRGPMADKHATAPRTPFVDQGAQLPLLVPGTRLHAGLLLALVAVPIVWFLLERTTIGFRIRAVGYNQTAARAAGISVAWTMALTLGLSGGLAGLAGASEVLGLSHVMPPTFSVGYGFDAIAVALLARSNPWAVVPAAFLFGALRNGAGNMQFETQADANTIAIVQAIVIAFVAAPLLVRFLFRLGPGAVPEVQITQRETEGVAG